MLFKQKYLPDPRKIFERLNVKTLLERPICSNILNQAYTYMCMTITLNGVARTLKK